MFHRWSAALAAATLLCATACQTVDDARETFGDDQLPILISKVSEGRDALAEASTQFEAVSQALSSLNDFQGDVEATYDRLREELSRCQGAVEDVKNRVGDVKQAAGELFDAWDEELGDATAPSSNDATADLRTKARDAYAPVSAAMAAAEQSMDFVLTSYRNQVMALKHDTTVETIGTIREDVGLLTKEIQGVLQDIKAAIGQADAFVSTMG